MGSHLVRELEAEGVEVVVLDDLSSGRSENLSGTKSRLVVGSVEDDELLLECSAGCDTVFHLAAVASVPEAEENPARCRRVNVEGTEKVLAAAERNGVERVVFFSSAAVYGEPAELPLKETSPTNAISVYAESKLAGEGMCLSWSERTGGQTVVARIFNGFGPRQRADTSYAAVVSRFLTAALSGKPLPIFGTGKQTRDFIFAKDVAKAVLHAAESGFCGVVNIASGKETSVLQLAQAVMSVAGEELELKFLPPRKGDIARSVADISLLRSLGFEPRTPLLEGLRVTFEALARESYAKA